MTDVENGLFWAKLAAGAGLLCYAVYRFAPPMFAFFERASAI